MSSPIVTHKKNFFKDALICVHQKCSHSNRVRVLAKKIASTLRREFAERNLISVLDIGCGDMQLAENIQRELPSVELTCLDIHPLPKTLCNDLRWQKYLQFDGRHLPFDQKKFDAAIFCDVLHHDQQRIRLLLSEAARVAEFIIVKDHFEHSLLSRWVLKALDFVGNWGYGVTLPKAYFRREEFQTICSELGLEIKHMDNEIDLYAQLPLMNHIATPSLQFIALLQGNR